MARDARGGRRSRSNNYSGRVYRQNYIYTNTSEAYELYREPEVYVQPVRSRNKANAPKAVERSTERMPLSVVKVFLCLLVSFCLSFLLINVIAANSARQRELIELRDQLEEVNESNAYLETKLNETLDLKRIEEIAQTRLGMTKPKSYQVKYIEVPKESYTVRYDTETEETMGVLEVFRSLIEG